MGRMRVFLGVLAFVGIAFLGAGCKPGEPLAGFTAEPTSGVAPLKVQFTDASVITKESTITGWAWEFGDGGTSTDQNPEHTYRAEGDYTVSLTVTSSDGKQNAATVPDYIKTSYPAWDAATILLPGDVPLELVRIPAGSFQMGSPDTERGRVDHEGPVHTVTIGNDFYMGKYEVTQGQWLAVMGATPGGCVWDYGAGSEYPAYYVSWEDAQAFVAAVNAHITATGQGPAVMRLPSEAEWEHACRAGTQTRFHFGDSMEVADGCEDDGVRGQYMWYCGTSANAGTKPVGGLLPNNFGLYDMSGNVYEWCEDAWHRDYVGAPADGSAWIDPSAADRVIRGGRWSYHAQYCRSAYRYLRNPAYRSDYLGFRLVALF